MRRTPGHHTPGSEESRWSDGILADALTVNQEFGDGHHPVPELLTRHWAPVYTYAGLCTSSVGAAGILSTVAFARNFGSAMRRTGPLCAWRPHLLSAVLQIAGEWDTAGRQAFLDPRMRSGEPAHRVRPGVDPKPNRRIVQRAFRRLPEAAQCLVWHTEVEAEDISIPAILVGLDSDSARHELDRAYSLLRAGCLQAHFDLATDDLCRHYNRLIDAATRQRYAGLHQDIAWHTRECDHCHDALLQLDHSPQQLPLMLAEALLPWRGADYLASRFAVARGDSDPEQSDTVTRPPLRRSGRHAQESLWGRFSRRMLGRTTLTATGVGLAAAGFGRHAGRR